MTSPFYPPYVNILTALGMQPVILEAGPETRFQPSVAMLEALDPPPDGLIVASPCNPAGTMLHRDELAAIAAWCDGAGVRLISDEIYHGLNYDSPIATAAGLSPQRVVVNSFSKYFSMTGWRIGWLVLPEDLVRPVECLAQNLFISAPHISQVAAEAAFDCHDELAGQRRALSPLARPSAAHAAGGRLHPAVAGRGRVLPVRRHRRPVERQRRVLRAHAGRGRGRGDAGRGFRPRARQPVPALQLLRTGGGHARGGGAAEGLAVAQPALSEPRAKRRRKATRKATGTGAANVAEIDRAALPAEAYTPSAFRPTSG